MTAGSMRGTMTLVADLAPGWGEAGLLIWRFVTLPPLFPGFPDALSAIRVARAARRSSHANASPLS